MIEEPATLFDPKQYENWQAHWVGMPAFNQKRIKPYNQVIVRFESAEDLKQFSLLVNQKISQKTKSIWFPFKSHWGNNPKMVWVCDES